LPRAYAERFRPPAAGAGPASLVADVWFPTEGLKPTAQRMAGVDVRRTFQIATVDVAWGNSVKIKERPDRLKRSECAETVVRSLNPIRSFTSGGTEPRPVSPSGKGRSLRRIDRRPAHAPGTNGFDRARR